MPLVLNNFVGFETGGLEEASASSGSPLAATSIVRTGSYALELNASDQYDIDPFESVSPDNIANAFGFAFRTASSTPTVDVDFLQALEGTDPVIRLRWEATSGDLILVDEPGSEVDTITNPFTVDTWHFVELRWTKSFASGVAEVFIDDSSSGLFVTNQQFETAAANPLDGYRFESPASGPDIYIDDVYIMTGISSSGQFLGSGSEVLGGYQNNVEDATDQGSALNNGTWADVGQTPFVDGTQADYQQDGAIEGFTICDEGVQPGPAGDAPGTIVGAKYIQRMARTNGSSPTTLDKSFGNSGDGVTAIDVAATLTVAFQNLFVVSEAASIVPTNSENFAMGMGQTGSGGRDVLAHEMLACLLHTAIDPSTLDLTDMNFPDQNSAVGPFGT